MRCQNCGQENPDLHIFCDRCGAVLSKPFRIDKARVGRPITDLRSAVYKRSHSDYHMPIVLVFVPLMITVGSIAATFAVEIALLSSPEVDFSSFSNLFFFVSLTSSLGTVISALVFAYIAYRLVKRQNDHYERERDLREATMSLVKAAAQTPEREQLVVGEMTTMSLMHAPIERRRVPWFWAFAVAMPAFVIPLSFLLSFVANLQSDFLGVFVILFISVLAISLTSLILQLIMFKFLGETMFDHDQRWGTFTMSARRALSKLGFPQGKPFTVSRLPERSFWLYLLLSFFTAGIFVYYWLYALAKDPNEHFKYQWTFEDNVLSSVESLSLR